MRYVRNAAFTALACLLVLAAPALAQVTPCKPKPVQKVHPVADLVATPPPSTCDEACSFMPCCAPAGIWTAHMLRPRSDSEDRLMQTIRRTVRPSCWVENGGAYSIDYFPVGMGLVVHAPDDVQKEVGCLLESLRKKHDTTIAVTLRFITVSEDFFERFGLDFDLTPPMKARACREAVGECRDRCVEFSPACCAATCGSIDGGCATGCCAKGMTAKAAGLSERQVHLLLEAVQGDRRACITSSPRVMMVGGQPARITMQEQQQFVTGVTIESVNGEQRVTPKVTTSQTGLNVELNGAVSADGKCVGLRLTADHTYLADTNVQLFPVTYVVTPKFADGGKGQPVPFTQFVQQPKFHSVKIDTHLNVPGGGTMLVYGGPIERVERVERNVPVLMKVPYLNRLFRNVTSENTKQHLLVLVTPTVVGESSVAPPCVAAKATCPATCCGTTANLAAVAGRETNWGCLACGTAVSSCAAPAMASGCRTACCIDMVCAPKPVVMAVACQAPLTGVQKTTSKLIGMYKAACVKGDTAQARELATMALDLDPTCFAKSCEAMVPASAIPVGLTVPARTFAPRLIPAPSFSAPLPPRMPTPAPAAAPIPGTGKSNLEPQWQQQFRLVIEAGSYLKLEPQWVNQVQVQTVSLRR